MRCQFNILVALFVFTSVIPSLAQANLFDHVYWEAKGTRTNQGFGISGLDSLGRINDSIPQALSIGSDGGACFVYNRFPLDTVTHFKFPWHKVWRVNLNSDEYPDYINLDDNMGHLTVFRGTTKIDSPVVAFSLKGNDVDLTSVGIVNADVDRDGIPDLVVSDRNYDDADGPLGRLMYFSGGDSLDSIPHVSVIGKSKGDYVGGVIGLAHLRDSNNVRLVEIRPHGSVHGDTLRLFEYPMVPGFHFVASDTTNLLLDSGQQSWGAISFADADGDGINDISVLTGYAVLIYKGGASIATSPTYRLHADGDEQGSIIDVGDVSGRGYHSFLVTAPQISGGGGYINGVVSLFDVGKALRDSIVAGAVGPVGFEDYFGTRVAALGDISGDGLADFAIGWDASVGFTNHVGAMTVFLGSAKYGPTAVCDLRKEPVGFRLDQNYPNPVSTSTDVTFAVSNTALYGSEVTLKIYDVLGSLVATAFRGTADGYGYTIRISTTTLNGGTYFYRLSCGGHEVTKKMCLIR